MAAPDHVRSIFYDLISEQSMKDLYGPVPDANHDADIFPPDRPREKIKSIHPPGLLKLAPDAPESTSEPVDPVDPWSKLDAPTLPRGVLPDIIERFAFEQAQDMGADPSGIAAAALAVCAAAIPDGVQVQVKRHNKGWLESARLWIWLVGLPSTMKTPAMAAAAKSLRGADSVMARQYAEERAIYDGLTKEGINPAAEEYQGRVTGYDYRGRTRGTQG
jgi:uncharacterized protein DUF3987